MVYFVSFLGWRKIFHAGNLEDLICPHDKRCSDIDFGDGCVSWISWSIRFPINCWGNFSMILMFSCLITLFNTIDALNYATFQVAGSQHWPEISSYRASVRAQYSRLEMIDALYTIPSCKMRLVSVLTNCRTLFIHCRTCKFSVDLLLPIASKLLTCIIFFFLLQESKGYKSIFPWWVTNPYIISFIISVSYEASVED